MITYILYTWTEYNMCKYTYMYINIYYVPSVYRVYAGINYCSTRPLVNYVKFNNTFSEIYTACTRILFNVHAVCAMALQLAC